MGEAEWTAVDAYFERTLTPVDAAFDAALEAALRENAAVGLPAIDVSPSQGKILHLIARLMGARRVLEIGALGGYSTLWLARALPEDGRVVTLEYEPRYAEVAARNIARAGLSDRVEIRVGLALDSLDALAAEGVAPFDLVFIDADKPNNPRYLERALRLTRRGGAIIGDNVVREGDVTRADTGDPSVDGVRAFIDMLAAEPRTSAAALQTVGRKGWDGFALAIVS